MAAASPLPVQWTSWPARERPGAAVAGGLAVLAFGVGSGMLVGHWAAGVATSIALFVALQRFYCPVHCSIDNSAARVRTLLGSRTMQLASVRRVAHDRNAILLSSRARPSNLDGLRGLMMPLPPGDPAPIVRALLDRVGGIVS